MLEFLNSVIPVIIAKVGYEKKFIQIEAKQALSTLVIKN